MPVFLISALRAIVEMLGLCLMGQGVLYLLTGSRRQQNAIAEVNEGRKYICDEVKNILAHQELEEDGTKPDMNALSRREIDIVRLIKEGMSSREIAHELDISLKTVEVHRYNILKKLNHNNSIQKHPARVLLLLPIPF